MSLRDEIECPKCQSEMVEPVPSFYNHLRTKGLGRKLFTESPLPLKTPELNEKQRTRLLHRLTPPAEPKHSLPAGTIAMMAFLVSWLTTGAILIARLGYQSYFILTMLIVLGMVVPFYLILNLVIHDFGRIVNKYNRLLHAWEKQYFCHECHHVFIPKE